MMRAVPLALAALCLASPLAAQDGSELAKQRTVEDAQAFLSTHIGRGGWSAITYEWFDGSVYRYFDGTKWQDLPSRPPKNRIMIEASVTNFDAMDRCISLVRAASPLRKRKFIEQSSIPLTAHDLRARLNWRDVDPVQLRNDLEFSEAQNARISNGRHVIWIEDRKTRSGIGLVHSDKGVAERAAFALSFLQTQCDPTVGGAF